MATRSSPPAAPPAAADRARHLWSAPRAGRPETVAERLAAERRFLEWLADPGEPDQVALTEDGPTLPMSTLLGTLCTSSGRLPAAAARTLGLPAGVTIGDAAAELVLAVNDPAGPRCRSYRAAVSYLHDLHAFETEFGTEFEDRSE